MIYLLRQLLLTILLFSLTVLNGQQEKINWGPELKGEGIVALFGEVENHLYATRVKINGFKPKISILKIDKTTLQIVEEKKVKKLLDGNIPVHTTMVEDQVHVLILSDKVLSNVVFDLELNEVSNVVFKQLDNDANILPPYMSDENPLIPGDIISSIESRDKNKVAIKITKPGKKKVDIEYHVFDTKQGYKHMYSTDLVLDKKETLEIIKDTDLLQDGSLNILVKQYNNKKGKEFKNKKPDYNFTILKLGINGEVKEIDLPNQKEFWKGPKISHNIDGAILVSAMSQNKPKGGATGFHIIKIGADNKLIFEKTHPLKNNDEKDKLHKSYGVSDFITINDNLSIIISENGIVRNFNVKGMTPNSKFSSDDVLLDGFDAEGNHIWSKRIYRNATENGMAKMFSSLFAFYNDEGLSIHYNTTEKNTRTLNSEKQKGEKLPNKKNVIVKAKLALDGSLSFHKVSSGNKLNFWPQVTRMYGESIYFLGAEDSWMKEMTIGVVK